MPAGAFVQSEPISVVDQLCYDIVDYAARFPLGLYHAFVALDEDGSGEVDPEEFAVFIMQEFSQSADREVDDNPAQTQAEIFRLIDTDGSGTLSWPEFEAFIEATKAKKTGMLLRNIFISYPEMVRKAWDKLDFNGDDEVSVVEFNAGLRRLFATLFHTSAPEEFDACKLFKGMDTNHDSKVDTV